ncbi:DUF3142 domain-containing protein [Pontiellaceae bacterium B12219]|nr:DUF3142 domain-containing protein [Pontiellaceae bacterium B12219]
MKHIAPILCLIFLSGMCRAQHAFYVWQQLWSDNVLEAVLEEPATTLYPVVTVMPVTGESTLMQIPWEKLKETKHRFVPVIRIPLKAFNRPDIETELVRLADKLTQFDEIQLDLDCPERRIQEYTALLSKLRKKLPQPILSITVLPSHMGNRSFRELVKTTDYYVLQVHGLSVPKHLNDTAELLNRKTADRAIEQAEALGHPYAIALPCYAYELNFNPETGQFSSLTAEGPARRKPSIKKRIAADPMDLVELVARFQSLEQARQIIWFRLPAAGDRLCLPRPTLEKIKAGILPAPGIHCEATPISPTTVELTLHNTNIIHATVAELALKWDHPTGAFDLYQPISTPDKIPGQLPKRLTAPIPPPGHPLKLGWFSTANPPTITVNLK